MVRSNQIVSLKGTRCCAKESRVADLRVRARGADKPKYQAPASPAGSRRRRRRRRPGTSSATSSRAGSTGPGMVTRPFGIGLEAGLAVVRLVAHQHHQPMALAACASSSARSISAWPMPRSRNGGSTVSGPSSSALRLADQDRRQPHRADQQRADARGERQLRDVRDLLADAIGGLGEPARPEGARVELLDRGASSGVSGRMVRERSFIARIACLDVRTISSLRPEPVGPSLSLAGFHRLH